MDGLIRRLRAYQPYNAQERADVKAMLQLLLKEQEKGTETDIFLRTNQTAHMTASSWIVDREREHALMAYHRLYDSWSWTGGHADGETDLLAVAMREACEETGLVKINPVFEDIYSVEILTVDGHIKHGEYVPSHLHLNVTYLLEADRNAPIRPQADENSAVRWFGLEGAVAASTEPWMKQNVYKKLNDKLKNLHKWRSYDENN